MRVLFLGFSQLGYRAVRLLRELGYDVAAVVTHHDDPAENRWYRTPSFVVGGPLLQGRPEKELAYIAGKKLTMMRGDHFVRWPHVVPTVSELKIYFLATLKLFAPIASRSEPRAALSSISLSL